MKALKNVVVAKAKTNKKANQVLVKVFVRLPEERNWTYWKTIKVIKIPLKEMVEVFYLINPSYKSGEIGIKFEYVKKAEKKVKGEWRLN